MGDYDRSGVPAVFSGSDPKAIKSSIRVRKMLRNGENVV
jgi:hypothetical protein